MRKKPGQIKIRMRDELLRKIKDAAQKADRSFNAEMVLRLETSFNLPQLEAITARLESVADINAKLKDVYRRIMLDKL